MSIFTEPLPEAIVVDGKSYPVRTGFRTWVEFDRLMTETTMPLRERVVAVLRLCFINKELPEDPVKTFSALFRFYSCFAPQKKGKTEW